VINMKIAPNDLVYLRAKFHIFPLPLAIFPNLIFILC
jgi:hypothetical protein